ncbi:hypothetical protein Tco_0369045 [Tanacetum coccineum]
MRDEHLNTILETEKSSVENLVPIPSDFKGISEDICDVLSCDHFDAECGLINSLLSQNSSITSLKIDFLPEEFIGELDFIDPILPGIDEDDFDEENFNDKEEGIDNDILQIEDKILYEKLLNFNLLVDKIEALKLTPFIPFVLENPSSSPILVVDSDFLVEEVETFLVSKESIPLGIESDLDSEDDIVFLDNLLNDDPIPNYERFTFDIEPDAPVINNFDELNEDECFDPGGVRLMFLKMLKMTIPSHLSFGLFSRIAPTLWILLYLSPPGAKTPFLTLASPLRAGGISSGWNFHVKRSRFSRRTKNDRVDYELDAKQGLFGDLKSSYTDIKEMDKIKAKTDKAEHEKERVHKSWELSSYGQQKSTLVNNGQLTK